MKKHALLSASSAHRWLNCPPSARLCEQFPDETSVFAAEGSTAHAVCEFKLKKALNRSASMSEFHNEEMEKSADIYVSLVLKLIENSRNPNVLIEQQLDYSKYVSEGFGTADCVIVADDTLYVIDYKYGQGILVEAENNPQMMLYAIGALLLFDPVYDISRVCMAISQPRRKNTSFWTTSKDALYDWAKNVLKPTADIAFRGEGSFKSGDWCRFCKAKHLCRERFSHNMELARHEFKQPDLLNDSDVEEALEKLDGLISWAKDVRDYAYRQALNGKKWKGWKLVESRTKRRFTDEKLVEGAAKSAGIYDIYNTKLKSLTALEELMGKEKFNDILGGFIEKSYGKPTLVPAADARTEFNNAKEDFSCQI